MVNDPVKSNSVPAVPSVGVVVSALAGLAAAWLAAGSTGLLTASLRHALTWVALGAVAVAGWPGLTRPDPAWLGWAGRFQVYLRAALLLAGLIAAVGMTASDCSPANVLASPLVLGLIASLFPTDPGDIGDPAARGARRLLALTAAATAVLGVYRLALSSIPLAWHAANTVGGALGRLGGVLAGQELSVGATFAGLDFLVLMGALYALWVAFSPAPRRTRAIAAAVFILAGHALYLVVLARATDLQALLPLPPERTATPPPGIQDPWGLSGTLRAMFPWNLPALAALIHLSVAAFMLRAPLAPAADPSAACPARRRWWGLAAWGAALAAACLLPVVSGLAAGHASLRGKTIVAYEKGFLNWSKPEHGPNDGDFGH
ncbi:MAG: hypothetical protein NTV86_16895, partial [Planctomycetota bacterium]|nr:hypothetical protein [Planctomycetota bacterium]